jgi:hypothetical protein
MASKTTIANMALSHLGVGHEIADLDTEKSEEANAIRTFYSTARDFVQSDFPWPFLTRSALLALVEEDPTDEWAYAYRYPSDALKIRRIFSPLRNDNRQSRIPYLIYNDASGKLIYTDEEDARIEYSIKLAQEDKWPSDFILAFSYLLASFVGPRLTKGDPFKMRGEAKELYDKYIQLAEQRSINEEQHEEVPPSEFVRSRDSDGWPYADGYPWGHRS